MKILLLGARGQLGHELSKVLPQLGNLIGLSRNELDLCNLEALKNQLEEIRPDLIINASAYTAVDKAEVEQEIAFLINAHVPEVLANYATKSNSILVHYSTDYVFDGQKNTPYTEADEANALSVYGASKLKGEQCITSTKCEHLILRTSWLYSSNGQNFLNTILKLANEKEKLTVINDQWGTPTSCQWLADVTVKAIKLKLYKKTSKNGENSNIFHATPNGVTNWFEYSRLIISEAESVGFEFLLKSNNIKAINSKEYEQKAQRPKFSGLNRKIEKNLHNHIVNSAKNN